MTLATSTTVVKTHNQDQPYQWPNGTCLFESCCRSSQWGHCASCTWNPNIRNTVQLCVMQYKITCNTVSIFTTKVSRMTHQRNVSLGENRTLLDYYTASSGNVKSTPYLCVWQIPLVITGWQ